MNIFILEDNPLRIKKFKQELIGHSVDVVSTVDDGKKLIGKKYDLMFLDHDLGGQEMVASGDDTGYELAGLISQSINKETPTIIHSCNHPGATAMQFVLPHAVCIPFPSLNISDIVENLAIQLL